MTSQREDAISLRHVWQAKKRMKDIVRATPLLSSEALSDKLQAQVYVKLENVHETGSFKIRGAVNKILSLSEEQREKGVTTFSTGNHGLAVAFVAKKLGIRAVICLSKRVPSVKIERLQRLGAEIIKVGSSQDEAEIFCYTLEEEQGLTVIKPFDDSEVIAGQGTIGLELLEDLPNVDMVIIPVSGGGLFSGIAYVLKQYDPSIQLVGVSMEKSPVMYESLRAKKPVSLEEQNTLADSLLGGIGMHNLYTFSMVNAYVDKFVLVSEEEIAQGMIYMAREHHLIIEGAAATGISALLKEKLNVKGKTIATVITGNHVDASILRNLFTKD